jgi:hypothetical protein
MKWVTYAAAMLGVLWAQWTVTYLWPVTNSAVVNLELVLMTSAMAGVPVAMGIAILRYRLYGIDVIIRKTLVYAILVAALSIVYVGGVFVLSAALRTVAGGTGPLVVTLSTLGVAASFQPLRRRIQHAVDHRFYRERYDTTRIIDRFNHRMRGYVDLDTLQTELVDVVTTTLQPRSVALWVPDERRAVVEGPPQVVSYDPGPGAEDR